MRSALASLVMLALVAASSCERRPVTVRIELPERADLDPTTRDDAHEVRVVVRDRDAQREAETRFLLSERGEDVDVESVPWGEGVEVRVEILSSLTGGLVGFGRALADLESGSEVVVAVRKLALYQADSDGRGDWPPPVRAFEVGPGGGEAPTYLPDLDQLNDLARARGLYVTADGRRLVVVGEPIGDDQTGLVVVYRTSDHSIERTIDLAETPSGIAPIADGSRALVISERGHHAAVIDLDSGEVADVVLFDHMGGTVDLIANDVVVDESAERAYVVGRAQPGGRAFGRVFAVELASGRVTMAEADERYQEYSGVRLSDDERDLYLLASGCDNDGCRAAVEIRAADTLSKRSELSLSGQARAGSLLVHPDGRRLSVAREIIYGNPNCCGGQDVLDIDDESWVYRDDEVAMPSAVLLPDGRMLGGLSHYANDSGGELVWLTTNDEIFGAKIDVESWVGHSTALAVPFGSPL